MSEKLEVSDDEITILVEGTVIARFEDYGNGVEGEVYEGDSPHRMSTRSMLALGVWLIERAKDRIE